MAALIIFLCVAASLAALAETFLLGCQSWEHLRRVRRRLGQPRGAAAGRHATLIVPCKGMDVGLRENLAALFRQDYPNYALLLVTESDDDAACPVIDALIAAYPTRQARRVTAGLAARGCQKVHNLKAAAALAPPETELLAFADSDARPGPTWLGDLVAGLELPHVGVVTGYRWFLPQRLTWANAVLYSINATAASLYTPKSFQPIWGGSWALRRDVFDRVGMVEAWDGRLTDDLVATRAIRAAGLRVEFEPRCMVRSPLDASWRESFAFLHRQYLIGRLYAPEWWTVALGATTLTVVGFWGGLAAAAVGWWRGAWWGWLPAAACAAWYGVKLGRSAIRRRLARLYVPDADQRFDALHRWDAWGAPLAAVVNWAALASSVGTRRMVWRGIEYRLASDGQAYVAARPDDAAPLSVRWPDREANDAGRGGDAAADAQRPSSKASRAA